eukprot:jgi/Chlat1/3137/Chrsp21S03371
MAGLAEEAAGLQRELGKRGSFEAAAVRLRSLVEHSYQHADAAGKQALRQAVYRAGTLLQTRYTSASFWRAGATLFEVATAAGMADDDGGKLRSYLAAAQDALRDTDENGPEESTSQPSTAEARARERYLFEGQLSEHQHHDRPVEPIVAAHNTLLNFFVEMAEAARQAAETSARAATSEHSAHDNNINNITRDQAGEHRQDNQPGGGDAGPEGSSTETPAVVSVVQEIAENVEELLQNALVNGLQLDQNFPGLEEAIALTFNEAGQRASGPPPASKKAVKALQKHTVTDEFLKELGAGTECSVCRECVGVGDVIQQMPCNAQHVFHPDCLAPWLEQHNSCPVCRFELPTDDYKYESRKEREKLQEAERRGAENAVREGQFMYT